MFDRIEFLISEAFVALRRNTWMTFAAITTATTALFLLGGLTFVFLTISKSANDLQQRIEIRVFMQEGAQKDAISQAIQKIAQIPSVREATLIPRDVAWKEYKAKFPDIVEDLDNPLPDSIRVRITSATNAPDIARRIQAMPGVEPGGVRYMDEARQVVSDSLKTLRWLGISLGVVMLLTAGILIYNTIRMTIVARRREIRIMHLVGATRFTIATPMVIEGVVQGAIGGLVAAGLIWACHTGFQRLLSDLAVTARLDAFPVSTWVFALAVAGSMYGLICSSFAMRDPRKVRG
jgi:cell division transport system permease protein